MLRTGQPIRERIMELMEKRSGIYEECADITVILEGKTYGQVADEIAALCLDGVKD